MITEVFKYRSYIQGLITENPGIMTSEKLQRKVHIKSSSGDCQTRHSVQEKYSPQRSFRVKIHQPEEKRIERSMFIQIDFRHRR